MGITRYSRLFHPQAMPTYTSITQSIPANSSYTLHIVFSPNVCKHFGKVIQLLIYALSSLLFLKSIAKIFHPETISIKFQVTIIK